MFGLGAGEMLLLAIVGLLLFGSRLPEVGKNLGKGIVEFKKGLAGTDDSAPAQQTQAAPPVQPQQPAQLPPAQHASATPSQTTQTNRPA